MDVDMAEPVPVEAAPVEVRTALSPSRAADFQNCPLLYRFRTIDRFPEPRDPVAVRGTLVHSVLEHLFDVDAAERTIEKAVELVGVAWAQLRVEDPELSALFDTDESPDELEWLASCRPLLESYFTIEDPRLIEPAARELRVDHLLESGLSLGGIIDRVDVAPDGRIRVVDFKTGKSVSERFEGKALFQMKFYALVIWRTRGVIPTVLQLYYLSDGTVLSYEPTEHDLVATERKVAALWSAISTALERGEFQPRKSALCNWCSHQDKCPEFGGVTPPMPAVTLVAAASPTP
jgi:putative RecB family exonuclease